MKEILGFTQWLNSKIREEFPDLNIITLISPHHSMRSSNAALKLHLQSRFGDRAAADLSVIDGEYDLSKAHTECPINTGSQAYYVSQINLDLCRVFPGKDFLQNFRSTSLHEAAHIIGQHVGDGLRSWTNEATSDLFDACVMLWLGEDDYPEKLLESRIKDVIIDPTQLSVVRNYNYPTIAADAEDVFFKKMRALRGKNISFEELHSDIVRFLEERMDALDSWFGFDDGRSAMRHETTELRDILGVAAQAGHPQVDLIASVMGVEPNLEYELQHNPNPFISRQHALLYKQTNPPEVPVMTQKQGKKWEDVLSDSPLAPGFHIVDGANVIDIKRGMNFSGNHPV